MKRLVLAALMFCPIPTKAQGPTASSDSGSPVWHQVAQADIENRIRDTMRDPESARFRNLQRFPIASTGNVAICGEVNGKNAYGGYAGYSRFWAAYSPQGNGARFLSLTLASDTIPQAFAVGWDALCK